VAVDLSNQGDTTMMRVLLRPTVFDIKATINRKANKVVAVKTKKNMESQLLLKQDFGSPVLVSLETKDFKEELTKESIKKGKVFGIDFEEIVSDVKR